MIIIKINNFLHAGIYTYACLLNNKKPHLSRMFAVIISIFSGSFFSLRTYFISIQFSFAGHCAAARLYQFENLGAFYLSDISIEDHHDYINLFHQKNDNG